MRCCAVRGGSTGVSGSSALTGGRLFLYGEDAATR